MGDAGAELRLASGRRCLVSFDAVYHAGGAWYWSRGWGVGQATEADGTLDGVALRRGLPIMPPGADAVRHPRPYVDHEASVEDAMRRKILARYDNTRRRDCTYGNNGRGAYYDCRTCLERFHVDKLTGTGEYGKGGVFVPMGKDIVGSTKQASTFFVDLERLTPFARGALPEEDPLVAQQRYERFFGVEPPPTGEHVPKVLRLMDGKRKLSTAIKSVARAASVDKAELARQVDAYLEARTQVPCSWLLVRIRYAGTGEQAFASLITLLDVVGNLDSKNATLIKHIKAASDLRRGA